MCIYNELTGLNRVPLLTMSYNGILVLLFIKSVELTMQSKNSKSRQFLH